MRSRGFLLAVIAAVVSTVAGCDRVPPAVSAHGTGEVRIVSLSPAITQTLIDLGLGDEVVGRTPFCRGVDPLPIVGDLMSIDYERLMQVTPTHVLVQPPAGGVDPGLIETAASTGITICSWPINTATDLLTLLGGLPECLGLATDVTSRCQELATEITTVMDRPPGRGRLIGPVLIVSPGPTPLAHGEASYLGELLTRHGGVNAIAAAWKQLSIEDIVTIDPGTIIIVSEAGSGDRESIVVAMGGDRTRAGTAGRIAFLIHPDALRPSSSLKDVAAELFDHLDTMRVEVSR